MKLQTRLIVIAIVAFLIGLTAGYLLFNRPEAVKLCNVELVNGTCWVMP